MQLGSDRSPAQFDEPTIELIAQRVIEALREDLRVLTATTAKPRRQLTVDDVAQQLGVARSTVYSHWREWGGYKLGRGSKAPIRFDGDQLPTPARLQPREPRPVPTVKETRRPRRRPRRPLLADAPRFAKQLDGLS
jgi:transposase-like protein